MSYKIQNGRLVEDIGEEPSMFDFYYPTQNRLDEKQYYKAVDEYNYRLANRKEYSCTPEHLPIFEAMGTVEDGDFEVRNVFMKNNNEGIPIATSATIYAIPRKNEDVWEEAWQKANDYAARKAFDSQNHDPQAWVSNMYNYLTEHYNLTRKK